MNTAIAVGPDQSFTGGFSDKTTPLMAAFAVAGFLFLLAAVRIMGRRHSHPAPRPAPIVKSTPEEAASYE